VSASAFFAGKQQSMLKEMLNPGIAIKRFELIWHILQEKKESENCPTRGTEVSVCSGMST